MPEGESKVHVDTKKPELFVPNLTNVLPKHYPHHLIKFWRIISGFLTISECTTLQFECMLFGLGFATRMPVWVIVGDGGYSSLKDALEAFSRFRADYPHRSFEIRLPENRQYDTGFRIPYSTIGETCYKGLKLDGKDRWNGLRIVMPMATISYGEKCRYSVEIHNGVVGIKTRAFYNCIGLVSITLPQGITTIGDGAFFQCKYLRFVNFPEMLTSIGKNAFCRCTSISSLIIPKGIKTIGNYAFFQCTGLISVTLLGKPTTGNYAFGGCTFKINGM